MKVGDTISVGGRKYIVTKDEGMVELTPVCPRCDGKRKIQGEPCGKCGGQGTL